jgi:hypothetical protein
MKKYDEAVLQYIETIGHLNPSYVIQKFIQVSTLLIVNSVFIGALA